MPNLVVRCQSKRYFSGLEHRHTGETLDEMHVSMARRGCYLSGRDKNIFKNWKREFQDRRGKKEKKNWPHSNHYPIYVYQSILRGISCRQKDLD